MAAMPRVHFYKQDHLGDPDWIAGRIFLGIADCKPRMRPALCLGDLVLAIGGLTATDGLADRLTWAGVVTAKPVDRTVEVDGYLLGASGPLTWRMEFPKLAEFVDGVKQGHRNRAITNLGLEPDFWRLFAWGDQFDRPSPGTRRSSPLTRGPCPPLPSREYSRLRRPC